MGSFQLAPALLINTSRSVKHRVSVCIVDLVKKNIYDLPFEKAQQRDVQFQISFGDLQEWQYIDLDLEHLILLQPVFV